MKLAASLVIAGLLFVAETDAAAQVASLTGYVRAREGGVPLADAVVEIPALQATVRASTTGSFTFSNVPPGRYLVIARMIGFGPSGDTVTIAEHRDQVRHFELRRAVTALDTAVIITRKARYISPNLQGFEERRANGFGKYLDEDFIRTNESRYIGDVLRMLPGISLKRAGGYSYAASSRNPKPNARASNGSGGGGVSACFASVYLDGVAMFEPYLSRESSPPRLEDLPRLNMLAAIEYYPGEASSPAQFRASPCGVLLLWTRER